MTEFHGIYKDEYGEEDVSIRLDENGRLLRMTLRGVEFTGYSFDTLSPNKDVANLQNSFSLSETNELHSFELRCETSVIIVVDGRDVGGLLKIHCYVCSPEKEWEEDAFLQLTLLFNNTLVQSDWCKTGFEDELINLAQKLPENTYLKCCSKCQFASYNPYWNSGLMGELACFVDAEDQHSYRGKGFPGWRKGEYVLVQELFVCSEFQPITSENRSI